MPELDHDVAELLRHLDDVLPRTTADQPPSLVRQQFQQMVKHLRTQQPEHFAGQITDHVVDGPAGGIPVRTYTPKLELHRSSQSAGHGVTIWIHGGGWVVGDLDSADPSARALATRTGSLVVSVDYRLAPEHPFPAGLQDCRAVLERALSGGFSGGLRPTWTAVGGDSAGGNLAAALALEAPSRGVPLAAALLIYPALDALCASSSYRDFAEGHLLTAEAMRYYWAAYSGAAHSGTSEEVLASPLMQPALTTDLTQMPPTVLTTAGFDPLRDEGSAFAARLAASGVRVEHLQADSLTHGWLDMTDIVDAARIERARSFDAFAGLLPPPVS